MGAWVKVGSGGKMRWDPDAPEDPGYAAERAQVLKEMGLTGKPPANGTFNPESTKLAAGRAMGKSEWESWKKRNGLVEVDKGDTSVRVKKTTSADVARKAIEEAREDLLRTGQYVAPGTPVTATTKEKMARGLPILRDDPDAPVDVDVDASDNIHPEENPNRGLTQEEVDAKRRPGVPWGYSGSKDALAALAQKRVIEEPREKTIGARAIT